MPANLTPQYLKAESEYRSAQTPEEELDCLQVMLREIPKHKGTDKLQADIKAKIAKLKADVLKRQSTPTRSAHKIPKQGAGRALLVGAPNSGKSQLLASLTRAKPEIAPYPFTTQAPMPGMMLFEDCPIQLIDLPPITADFFDPTVLGLIRGADVVLLVVDLDSDSLVEDTQAVLAHLQNSKTRLGRETCLDEEDIGTTYTQTIVLLNKIDSDGATDRKKIFNEFLILPFDQIEVSGATKHGLDELTEQVFRRLNVVRVYTKNPKAKEPDMSKPFIVKQGQTLIEVADQIHRDLATTLRSARVWKSAIHPCTTVKPDYQPQDKDIVELHSAAQ
jgi:uncharacterized protein